MYDQAVREQALALLQTGVSLRAASLVTGISRATLRDWREHPDKPRDRAACPRCIAPPGPPKPQWDYAYLLGLYLGDGCISVGGDPAKGVWALRIFCADAWPGLRAECQAAMRAIRPANKASLRPRDGCTEVISYSQHWPCLFPQHGPGKKHTRGIKLDPWQQDIVDRHPGAFARGLFHSDGCRFLSRSSVRSPAATAGMRTRGTCSPTSLRTSSACAGSRWTGSVWTGASPDAISGRVPEGGGGAAG
jgi:hypothetical protein